MDSEELLAQLADIHLPEPVGFWPPAPGWWLLAGLLLVAAVWLGRLLLAKWIRHRICAQALAELEACYEELLADTDESPGQIRLRYLNAVNSVLRRVALVHFPPTCVASLSGSAWVDFLRQNGDASFMDEELAGALIRGRFQSSVDFDVDALLALGRQWITSVYRQRISSGRGAEGPDPGLANRHDVPSATSSKVNSVEGNSRWQGSINPG